MLTLYQKKQILFHRIIDTIVTLDKPGLDIQGYLRYLDKGYYIIKIKYKNLSENIIFNLSDTNEKISSRIFEFISN